MAYDEGLAERIREALADERGVSEKKMFGGVCFLVEGKMVCGVVKSELMVRVGPEQHPHALAQPDARPMDFTGRPLKGLVYVGEEGVAADARLRWWISLGLQGARAKPAAKSRRPRRK